MMSKIDMSYLADRSRFGLWVYDDAWRLFTDSGLTSPDPGTYREPTVELDKAAAERLMTRMWDAGLRPEGVDQGIEAMNNHLQDMRRLVFGEEK